MPLGGLNRRRDRAELSAQIGELKAQVEVQGEMLRRLVGMLDAREGEREKGKHRAEEEVGARSWS